MATVAKIGVLFMRNTHIYTWNGETFLQKAGAPIGLRSPCAVAMVVMNKWDSSWMKMCTENNIKVSKNNRYMDDIWAFLKSLKEEWRAACFTERNGSKRTRCLDCPHPTGLRDSL